MFSSQTGHRMALISCNLVHLVPHFRFSPQTLFAAGQLRPPRCANTPPRSYGSNEPLIALVRPVNVDLKMWAGHLRNSPIHDFPGSSAPPSDAAMVPRHPLSSRGALGVSVESWGSPHACTVRAPSSEPSSAKLVLWHCDVHVAPHSCVMVSFTCAPSVQEAERLRLRLQEHANATQAPNLAAPHRAVHCETGHRTLTFCVAGTVPSQIFFAGLRPCTLPNSSEGRCPPPRKI